MTIQGYNLSTILNGIVNVSKSKITLHELMQDIGLSEEQLQNKNEYLDWIYLAKALEKAVTVTKNPYIGLMIGGQFSPIGLGPELSFFMQICPDLRTAAIGASEHTKVIGGVTQLLYQENKYDFLVGFKSLNEWRERFPESYRVCAELNAVIIRNIAVFLTQGVAKPYKIIFEHEEQPKMKEVYYDFWGQNISFEFGQKANGGVFYTEKMKTANPAFDITAYQNYQEQLLSRKSKIDNIPTVSEKIKAIIKENLFIQHKDISQEDVAAQIFMTTKAIQRTLKKENTSWNELKNEVRVAWIKENILYQSDTQIGDLLSFSNINNFTRWFKSKFGVFPKTYRTLNGLEK
jgi:AraC-like DNA-binding protein/ribulose bisphosphate carboxylase small subunit